MRAIRNLIMVVFGLTFLSALGLGIAAAFAKGRMTSHGGEADDEVDLVAIFDGIEFRSRASAFRRGSVLTWFGGGTVDLRGATLDPAGATLELRALFGGLQLIVPEAWRLEQHLVGILGGVGDLRDPMAVSPDGPVLTVTGFATFGGVGITSDSAGLSDRPVEAAADAGAGG